MHFHPASAPDEYPARSAVSFQTHFRPQGQYHSMEEKIMLTVSPEMFDKMKAPLSASPKSVNRHTTSKSNEKMPSVIGTVFGSVVGIRASEN
jgi:hypothetical protein